MPQRLAPLTAQEFMVNFSRQHDDDMGDAVNVQSIHASWFASRIRPVRHFIIIVIAIVIVTVAIGSCRQQAIAAVTAVEPFFESYTVKIALKN